MGQSSSLVQVFQKLNVCSTLFFHLLTPLVYGYYENIFIAALDHGDFDTADKYLRILVDKFPQSSRVKRLLGMAQEAQGHQLPVRLILTVDHEQEIMLEHSKFMMKS
jgi:hypothetical protein